ncbi:MAG: metallo-beta-lactamase family protein [Clostridia bacterium]|jgi:metallo-beta-lactamase family protein|nr:metallo-beta-lactamase family protein [Clostridia bacterium]MDN5324158.1 metallo-beta-lactamase family protein [Clostridia bacterium]
MQITFYGAAGTVTGSCFKVTTTSGSKILVDCGLFQGPQEIKERNYVEFPFDPKEIDVVVLTHAHIDHSGLIPKLCKKGYKGKIYATSVTVDLCSIMLPDAAHIQEMEVERKNRKLARANKPLLQPIYTIADAEKCMEQFYGVNYDTKIEILPGIIAVFRDAGHILGSAMIELYADGKKIVFSGDIGNINQPIINDPTEIKKADYIVMESTYGNRFHLEAEDKMVQLARIIKKTIKKGGHLVIPAFAVERTQDLIYSLGKLINSGEIPEIDVYIDSPLAIKATEIFCKYPEFYDEEASELNKEKEDCPLNFPGLKFALSTEESKAINFIKNSAIIISASGMCDAGRIKHHLKHNLWRPESTVLFVGYQAQGTLGRRILDGEKLVKIHGEEIAINADIEKIEGFSAHADQKGLVEWVKNFTKDPEKIFLVHGEPEAMKTLSKILQEETGNTILIPEINETFELDVNKINTVVDKEKQEVAQDKVNDTFVFIEKKLKDLLVDEKNRIKILEELEQLKKKFSN